MLESADSITDSVAKHVTIGVWVWAFRQTNLENVFKCSYAVTLPVLALHYVSNSDSEL